MYTYYVLSPFHLIILLFFFYKPPLPQWITSTLPLLPSLLLYSGIKPAPLPPSPPPASLIYTTLVSICISFPGHPSTCTCITFFHARTFFPYMCVSHLLHHINPSLIKVQVQWEMGCPCTALQINGSRFEPWPGHCVLFLGKTLYSHSASPCRSINGWG